MAQQVRGSLAWLWGLLFGGLTAALLLIDRLAPVRPVRRAFAFGQIPLLPFLLGLLFFFLAGLIAARRSHRLEAGILAGFIAGLCTGLLNAAFVLVALVAADARARGSGVLRAEAVRVLQAAALSRSLGTLVLLVLVGLAMGALGGLAGRDRPPAAQPMQPTQPNQPAQPYVPMPPPQMPPQYPSQPPSSASHHGGFYPSSTPYAPSDDPTILTNAPPQP